ncbi:MAG: family 10 glycosylhydrolase [Limisphaerales bacterium]
MRSSKFQGGLLTLLALAFCLVPSAGFSQTEPEFRALWVDAWGNNLNNAVNCYEMITNSRAGNFNALVIQARRRGDAFYNSNYEPKSTGVTQPNFDPLGYTLSLAHDTSGGKKKIEIHAWMVTYHIWRTVDGAQPPQPDHPLNLHPDWLLSDVNGNTLISGQYTFDPGHPEVQRHTYNVAMDIVTNYPVDGIHFDYVRYSSPNEGYNPVSVARFNRLYGRTGQPVPTDADWKQFRRDQVTALVRKVYLNAIAARPEVKVTAATITWAPGPTSDTGWYNSSAAWNSVLQDWRGWMEEGILDINMPMNYFRQWTHLNDFVNWSTFAKNRKFNRHFVNGPGIYLNSVDDAIWQMRHSRTPTAQGNKADGMIGYVYKQTNKDSVPTTTFMKAMVGPSVYDTNATPIFQTWVPTPDMPWKSAPTRGHLKGYLLGNEASNFLDGGTISISGPVNKTIRSDGTGFYGAVDLQPGNYTATASFPGYSVVTTNFTVAVGQVTDLNIVLPSPGLTIIEHPQSQSVNAGADVTFTVAATGVQPISYQWLLNNVAISGATTTELFLPNVQATDAGSYAALISNSSGSVISSNAVLTVRVAPTIVSQPQSVSAQQGDDVAFSVTVTGTEPLTYQWRRNGTNIIGATQNTYTRFNVQPADAANYSVFVSNAAGNATSANAALTVSGQLVAPYIVAQPQNRTSYEGQSAAFTVRANGSAPFSYQWRFNGQAIAGATRSMLAMSNVTTNQAGQYSVVISNSVSFITSAPATLSVVPPFPVGGMEVLWKLGQGSRPYIAAGNTERGVAYNPVSGNVLLVSRASGNRIIALDADTGNELHQMSTSGVTGGTFALNMIGVADDGVVYACNLVTAPPGFKIYRWANEDPTTVPTVIYNGNPGGTDRWGDSFAVRGSGASTQILVGGRQNGNHCLFTTTDGVTFTPNIIRSPATPGSVTSLAFGAGNSFWTKEPNQALFEVSFSLGNTNGTLASFTTPSQFPSFVVPIGVDPAFKVLGGVGIETPDRFRLYNIASHPPRLIASEPFATDNANANWVGSVAFGDDRVYALDTNNGLIALRLLPQGPIRFHSVSLLPGNQISVTTDTSTHEHKVQASADLIQWIDIGSVVPHDGSFSFSDPGAGMQQRFYRLVLP